MTDILFRSATPQDAESVAGLHARNWREHYRGIYADPFLDDEALVDRNRVWKQRLTTPDRGCFTVVADRDGAVIGFAHAILDKDSVLGAAVQNLHVATDHQRHGVGSRLMAEVARTVISRRPRSGLHVWAREDNDRARTFYTGVGGTVVESRLGGPFPDGSRAQELCFAWPDPSTLLQE